MEILEKVASGCRYVWDVVEIFKNRLPLSNLTLLTRNLDPVIRTGEFSWSLVLKQANRIFHPCL